MLLHGHIPCSGCLRTDLPSRSARNEHRRRRMPRGSRHPPRRKPAPAWQSRLKISELKHHHVWSADPIRLSFATASDIRPFDFGYDITANEPPEPIKGNVRLEFSCEGVEAAPPKRRDLLAIMTPTLAPHPLHRRRAYLT